MPTELYSAVLKKTPGAYTAAPQYLALEVISNLAVGLKYEVKNTNFFSSYYQ